MEQHITESLKQNQELILALQRTNGSSQKVTVQFEKFDEENENFDSVCVFFERFQMYLDVQNIPADSRAKFDIVFRKTADHGNADFLSRLPKTSEELEVKDDITIFQMTQIETLPVTSRELRQETGKDEELGPLLRALREGKNLQGREAQCTIEDGCILYGQRVCIPKKYQKNVLDELHTGHLDMVKMKALARSFVYWKDVDIDIEEAARNCVDCARHKTDSAKSKVQHWEYPGIPWERIHIDFAGPIFEHMFLLIVDAHSKWLEVYPMKVTTTKKTIECLRDSFARFG
ncbi:Uncharacterized protein K02A2.6 [Araneus ventricosus]|uniref:RNA-directed DNA polymerase n=1 Tax=Araneus ventricosus TaxID=182803 RepID=A0A4Y2BHW2_ARAVE|nr:Uncharacterized protein K02A2.6 [Araneus ventricosus]